MSFTMSYYYLIFFCIFKICIRYCLCTSHEIDMYTSKSKDDFTIDSEEIQRRRKLLEPYLAGLAAERNEWIETYDFAYRPRGNTPHETSKLKNPVFRNDKNNVNSPLVDDSGTENIRIENYYESKFLESETEITQNEFNPKIVLNSLGNHEKDMSDDEPVTDQKAFQPVLPELVKEGNINVDSRHLILDKGLHNIPSDKNVETADSFTDIRSRIKRNDFCVRKNIIFYLTKTCDAENYIKTHYMMPGIKSKKISSSSCEKHKGQVSNNALAINSKNVINQYNSKDSSEYLNKGFTPMQSKNSKHSVSKVDFYSQTVHKQNLVNSYLTKLNQAQENWIESYDYNYIKDSSAQIFDNDYVNSKSQFLNSVVKTANHAKKTEFFKESLYFNRWVNKLLNKFSDYPLNDHSRLSFSFSADSLNTLKELSSSKNFDIVILDKLLSDLISNATLIGAYSLDSSFGYMPMPVTLLYVLGVIFVGYILTCFLNSRFLIICVFIIIWNGFKKYQQKLAEKHAVMSSINSAYCESILTQESGVLAHIKEYFRHVYHNDECKKYYAALMIDPLSEISIPVVISDLFSSAFSQIFQPIGHGFNVFYKELVNGLGYFERFYLLVVLIIMCYFCISLLSVFRNYKLKLPFFMGSIEPSVAHSGSRVEDVKLEKQKDDSQNSCSQPQIQFTAVINTTDVFKGCYVSQGKVKSFAERILPLDNKQYLSKEPKILVRRSSF